jgi:hypothetical protein
MLWIIGGIVLACVLLAILFAIALGRATRSGSSIDKETRALTELNNIKSPSGTPFFPTDDSIWDLAHELEELDVHPEPEPEPER